ncbi:MAG: hypothetical protein QGG64_22935 [Candidatus Latescibacteria bacterium]|jgi:hypothetical protein|nr:hypothetical protein [Candidatus Latescibacterota bacterium]
MILDLDQLIEPYFDKYPNEWLLFEVTETDEHDWPTEVQFVAHDPSREAIANIVVEKDLDDTLVRFAGDVLPEGWHAAL